MARRIRTVIDVELDQLLQRTQRNLNQQLKRNGIKKHVSKRQASNYLAQLWKEAELSKAVRVKKTRKKRKKFEVGFDDFNF